MQYKLLSALLLLSTSSYAEVQLYETGPSEDSSFLRFVNASDQPLHVEAGSSKARLALTVANPSSGFQPVRARTEIKGTLVQGDTRHEIALAVQPGEFVTVLALQNDKKELVGKTLREKPDSFNALKASLGFVNVDQRCADAGLKAAGREVMIFEHGSESIQRRMINPVSLSVQLMCAGQPVGRALDLGALQAGQRYSLFVVPSAQGSVLLYAPDSVVKN